MKKKSLYTCALCGKPLAEQRPVFLIVDARQEIRGPLHAGCAEKLHLDRKRELTWDELTTTRFGAIVPRMEQGSLFDAEKGDEERAE